MAVATKDKLVTLEELALLQPITFSAADASWSAIWNKIGFMNGRGVSRTFCAEGAVTSLLSDGINNGFSVGTISSTGAAGRFDIIAGVAGGKDAYTSTIQSLTSASATPFIYAGAMVSAITPITNEYSSILDVIIAYRSHNRFPMSFQKYGNSSYSEMPSGYETSEWNMVVYGNATRWTAFLTIFVGGYARSFVQNGYGGSWYPTSSGWTQLLAIGQTYSSTDAAAARTALSVSPWISISGLSSWSDAYARLSVILSGTAAPAFILYNGANFLSGGKIGENCHGTICRIDNTYAFFLSGQSGLYHYSFNLTGFSSADVTPTISTVYRYTGTAV